MEKPYISEDMPELLEEQEYWDNLRNFTVTLVGQVVVGYQVTPIKNYTVSDNKFKQYELIGNSGLPRGGHGLN